MDPTALRGMTTPLVTPFSETGIDWQAFDRLLERVLDAGIDAVFPCGTTGEFASLSRDEREAVVERTVAATPVEQPVIAGGTGTDIPSSRRWLQTLDEAGVDAAVVTAPYFHTANDPSGLERFFDRLLEDSPMPVILYNIPSCVGDSLPVEVVARLATHSQVIGLKDSSGELEYGLRIKDATPDEFLVLQGYDTLLVPALRMDFDGGVNALSNVYPGTYREIVTSPELEQATRLHATVIEPLFADCRSDGFAAVTKAALAATDVLPRSTVRPPLSSVSPDEVAETVARGIRLGPE